MGSTNLRSSAFRDHGRSAMHQYAMHLLKKSCSKHITEYAFKWMGVAIVQTLKRSYLLICTLTLTLVIGKFMFAANFFLYDNNKR